MGELYFNYAETSAEYNGELDADAIRYFKAIRTKAGLPSLAESFGSPKGQELIQIVRRERMVEFCFESQWLYDVKRWKIAEEFFAPDANGMRGLNSAGATMETFNTPRILPERPITFSRKQYFYPINQSYIDINKSLVQNPGW